MPMTADLSDESLLFQTVRYGTVVLFSELLSTDFLQHNCRKDLSFGRRPGGLLHSNRLMGMCRWMGSHFHDWIDCNGVPFSIGSNRVTRMGSHICGISRVSKFR